MFQISSVLRTSCGNRVFPFTDDTLAISPPILAEPDSMPVAMYPKLSPEVAQLSPDAVTAHRFAFSVTAAAPIFRPKQAFHHRRYATRHVHVGRWRQSITTLASSEPSAASLYTVDGFADELASTSRAVPDTANKGKFYDISCQLRNQGATV